MDKRKVHNYGETLSTIIMCISTIATVFLSYFVWRSEERANAINEQATQSSNAVNNMNMELERYRQTIQLCDKVTALYKSFNTPTRQDIVEFKLWEMGENFDVLSLNGMEDEELLAIAENWKNSTKEERINILIKNSALTELFYFFEDAMMLYRKGLLDNRYFDNYLSTITGRLQRTSNPSVDEYINRQCQRAKRNDIWEGFHFCCDSIMLESIIVPDHSNEPNHHCNYTARLNVHKGDMVKKGDAVVRLYHHNEPIPSHTLTVGRSGRVDKILINDGETVTDGQILMEVTPK